MPLMSLNMLGLPSVFLDKHGWRQIHSVTFVSFPADYAYRCSRYILQPDMPVRFFARPVGRVK